MTITAPEDTAQILIADHDGYRRGMLKRALARGAYRVIEAADGAAALARVRRSRPDLVLLDVQIGAMDAFTLCSRIRGMGDRQSLPILMLIASDDVESVERALDAGATDFIAKPVNPSLLGPRVRYALRASQMSSELYQNWLLLARAQRLAKLGCWTLDRQRDRIQCSDEAARILGLPATVGELGQKDFLALVHPEDRSLVRGVLADAAKAYQPFCIEYRIVRSEGVQRYVCIQTELLRDGNGRLAQLMGTLQDITERKQEQALIERQACYDNLTDLPNRRLFYAQVRDALAQAKRDRRARELSAILFLDLDNFKRVNDTLGHAAGDLLLKSVASRLKSSVRESDTVARLGGDEFTVILRRLSSVQAAGVITQNILNNLSKPYNLDGHEMVVTPSIGISVYPLDAEDEGSLLKNADAAMYQAKGRGGHQYRYYTSAMNAGAHRPVAIDRCPRNARRLSDRRSANG